MPASMSMSTKPVAACAVRHLVQLTRTLLGNDIILYTTDPPPYVSNGTLPGDALFSCALLGTTKAVVQLCLCGNPAHGNGGQRQAHTMVYKQYACGSDAVLCAHSRGFACHFKSMRGTFVSKLPGVAQPRAMRLVSSTSAWTVKSACCSEATGDPVT